MRKLLLTLCITGLCTIVNAQLLTWGTGAALFPSDNSTITITVDATKGNQGLLGFAGPVYMHLGVITNLSTNSSDWKHVTTTWASTTAPTATSSGANKWQFIITN